MCKEEERFASSLNLFSMLEVTIQLILMFMPLCLGSLRDGSVTAKGRSEEGCCAESQTGLHKSRELQMFTTEVGVDPLIFGAVSEAATCLSIATYDNRARIQSGSASDLLGTHLVS